MKLDNNQIDLGSVKSADVIGANITTDSGMESWAEQPQNAFVEVIELSTFTTDNTYLPTKTGDSAAGTYALKFNGSTPWYSVFGKELGALVETDEVAFSFKAKTTVDGVINFIVEYSVGEDSYGWNWTGASAGTFTIEPGGVPTADQMYAPVLTTSYATYNAPSTVIIPAGVTAVDAFFLSVNNNTYLDDVSYILNAQAPVTFCDFETWELATSDSFPSSNMLFGYNLYQMAEGDSSGGTATREGAIKHAGSYSVKLLQQTGDTVATLQGETGLTVGATYDLSIWGYVPAANATGVAGLMILNNPIATATQYYNPTTDLWVTDTPANGLFTAVSAEDAWTEYTERMIIPATGNVYVYEVLSSGTDNDVVYFDDFTFKPVTLATNRALFNFTNATDATNLEAEDTVIKFVTTGGTDFNHLSSNGLGVYTTDYSTYNFASKPVAVGNATGGNHALNLQTSDGIVGAVGSINLKATGQTTIYTVPTGYIFYPTKVYLESTAVDTLSVLATLSMGVVGGSYNDIINGYTSLTLPTQGTKREVTLNTDVLSFAAGSVIKLDVDIGSTATTHTGKIYLMGFLIAV